MMHGPNSEPWLSPTYWTNVCLQSWNSGTLKILSVPRPVARQLSLHHFTHECVHRHISFIVVSSRISINGEYSLSVIASCNPCAFDVRLAPERLLSIFRCSIIVKGKLYLTRKKGSTENTDWISKHTYYNIHRQCTNERGQKVNIAVFCNYLK